MTFEKRRREGFRNVFEEGRGNVKGSGGGKDERSGGGVAIVGGSERSEVDEEERRDGGRGEGGEDVGRIVEGIVGARMVGSEARRWAKGEGWFRDGGRDGTWFVHFPERSARFLRARS